MSNDLLPLPDPEPSKQDVKIIQTDIYSNSVERQVCRIYSDGHVERDPPQKIERVFPTPPSLEADKAGDDELDKILRSFESDFIAKALLGGADGGVKAFATLKANLVSRDAEIERKALRDYAHRVKVALEPDLYGHDWERLNTVIESELDHLKQ